MVIGRRLRDTLAVQIVQGVVAKARSRAVPPASEETGIAIGRGACVAADEPRRHYFHVQVAQGRVPALRVITGIAVRQKLEGVKALLRGGPAHTLITRVEASRMWRRGCAVVDVRSRCGDARRETRTAIPVILPDPCLSQVEPHSAAFGGKKPSSDVFVIPRIAPVNDLHPLVSVKAHVRVTMPAPEKGNLRRVLVVVLVALALDCAVSRGALADRLRQLCHAGRFHGVSIEHPKITNA